MSFKSGIKHWENIQFLITINTVLKSDNNNFHLKTFPSEHKTNLSCLRFPFETNCQSTLGNITSELNFNNFDTHNSRKLAITKASLVISVKKTIFRLPWFTLSDSIYLFLVSRPVLNLISSACEFYAQLKFNLIQAGLVSMATPTTNQPNIGWPRGISRQSIDARWTIEALLFYVVYIESINNTAQTTNIPLENRTDRRHL